MIILSLTACADKESEKKQADSKDTVKPVEYNEKWVLEPSIQADNIFSLPIVEYNHNTNHYDVSYGDVYVAEKGGKFGFINSNGEMVIDFKYDTVETCTCTRDYIATIKPEGSYRTTYYINESLQETWHYPHACEAFSGYGYKWNAATSSINIIKIEGDSSTPTTWKTHLPETVEVAGAENESSLFVLASPSGIATQEQYDCAGVFSGGLAAFSKNKKWGYVDSQGKEVIPFEYDAVEGYSALGRWNTPFECAENYVTVEKDGKRGIYKADGTLVVPCQYNALTTVHDGRAFASNEAGLWGILCIDEQISSGIAPVSQNLDENDDESLTQ